MGGGIKTSVYSKSSNASGINLNYFDTVHYTRTALVAIFLEMCDNPVYLGDLNTVCQKFTESGYSMCLDIDCIV